MPDTDCCEQHANKEKCISALREYTSFFFFTKGSPFQTLLHELKYHNNTAIGRYMGKMAATELLNAGWLADIDLIVPIPLHPKKLQKRGYNQSMEMCKGIKSSAQVLSLKP